MPEQGHADALEDFIGGSTWGRHLEPAQLQRILAAVRDATYEEGDFIVREGFPADYWVGLMSGLGTQTVTDATGEVVHLSAGLRGTWFGEGTLIRGGPWEYDAIALRRTRVALVPASLFRWLRDTSLPFNHHIQEQLNERLSALTSLAITARAGSAMNRVAGALWHLSHEQNRCEVTMQITQAELGMLAGVSRQRTNAALTELRSRGVVAIHRAGGVDVLDRAALQRATQNQS